jgi:minor extracellular serine protease Vpr
LKKNIILLIFLLLFQFIAGALPNSRIFALQSEQQSIDLHFLAQVSSTKSLVPIMVELKKDPTLDYIKVWRNLTISERGRIDYRNILSSYQDDWLKNLQKQGISFIKTGSCTDTINMVALEIKGTDIDRIKSNRQVKKIYDDRMLVKPSRILMAQSTGVDKVWKGADTTKATGKDVVVGVIDTGMDGDHPEFTGKILGGKNYIGEGTFKTDSYIHGTHVAGIIGGLGDASHGKGMAPSVRFFSYKALGPQGGSQSGIMEGMDQAVKDKCQIINMSLGRVGGEESKNGNPYYAVIKRIVDANVIVVAASGNSGARGKSVPWPAGSPGIVEDAFCVAASNDRNARMTYSSKDRMIQALYDSSNQFNLKDMDTKDMIDCQYGRKNDFLDKEVKGKIAIIKRGPLQKPISFTEKMKESINAGAKAVIFVEYQNNPTLLPVFKMNQPLPFLLVSNEDGDYLLTESQTDKAQSILQIEGLSIADFSSMGITPDGAFKPEITAPGVNIMSTFPKKYGSYYAISGTSMACPSIAGQIALLKEAHPMWKINQIKSAMMNTAYILMNPVSDKPVTFMLQGAGQARVEKAMQTPAFISPRAFVVEKSENEKISFTVTNALKENFVAKVSVEYFIDAGEESPVEIELDKKEVTISEGSSITFSANVKIDKAKFVRPRIEGVIWVGDLHIPFIILRESSVTDNGKAVKNPISDIFCSSQQIDYSQPDKPIRVNFSFNTGTEQKFEGEISYSNFGSVKIYLTDPQGLLWDPRPIKEYKSCVVGDYSFEWNMLTASKEALPNGQFSLKFECSASDDNEIVSKPLLVTNSPQENVPTLILASPRYVSAESSFSVDVFIPTLNNVKEIEYTLYFDTKKVRIDKAEKTDNVISWDTPTYKSDNVRIKMNQFTATEGGNKRFKLATIYFSAKGLGPLKFSNKAYVTIGKDKKLRTLGFIPDIQITKKSFLIADVNNDNVVDLNDYFLLVKVLDSSFGEPLFKDSYDLNQDLTIDQTDLDIILDELGKQL